MRDDPWGMFFGVCIFSEMPKNQRLSVLVLFRVTYFSLEYPTFTILYKLGCIVRIVVDSILPHAESGSIVIEGGILRKKRVTSFQTQNYPKLKALYFGPNFGTFRKIFGAFRKIAITWQKFYHKILPRMLFGSLPGAIP